ncbi:hypothetical protein [Rhizobium leguminosarum]|uniref:hypothetical protein n=1 Tax=Rhizobium TaxID=379 RepID=UPI00140FCFA2|nr:hypothetical protein [Rhizobium leguminosarum]QIO60467.1 hypothetical protein HA463_23365 [Rhizobium leguminosarum bv. trifolii]
MDILAWIGDSRVGGLLSIIGIALAVASYFWRRQKTLLRYALTEASIASAHKEGRFKDELEIYFQGKPVPTVTSSVFWVWNGGNTLVRSSDMASLDPLMVILPQGSTILRFTVGTSSRPVNNSRLVFPGDINHEAILEFDFLEPNEGFLFELVHTAARNAVKLRGTLINSPQSPVFSRLMPASTRRDFRRLRWVTAGLFAVLALGTAIPQIFPQLQANPEWWKELTAAYLSAPVQYLIAAISAAAALLIFFWPWPGTKLPSSLEDMLP